MNRPMLWLSLLVASLALASPAVAQTAPQAEGLELNERGLDQFQSGDFQGAAQTFARAYDLVGDPGIRKNEAIAWFKANRCEEAISAANKYLLLDEAPADEKDDVRTVIANCKVTFAREAVDTGSLDIARGFLIEAEGLNPDQHVVDQIALVRMEIAKKERASQAAEEQTGNEEVVATETPPPAASPPILEYVLMGTGGALILTAAIYHALAYNWQAEAQRMSREGGDAEQFERLKSRVGTARIAVPFLYTLGIASAGTGLVLYSFVNPGTGDDAASGVVDRRFGIGMALEF